MNKKKTEVGRNFSMKMKVSIIGAGCVGGTLAYLIVQSELADVVIYDIAEGVPQGKALDISEAGPLWISSSSIIGTNDYAATAGSDIIVVTAGYPRKPGMSRDDLLLANAKVVSEVVSHTSILSPDAIFIIVTNPVDAMAQLSLQVSGFDRKRVIGMGGILDSARFRTFVAWEAGVSPRDVEALVMGGHGDQMVPMPRYTTIKGVPITELFTKERVEALVKRTRDGGAEVVALLKSGSAYYAPAAAIFHMVKAIISDEKRLLPCAAYLDGEYGMDDVYNGVPVVIGRKGIEKIVELMLNDSEMADFTRSVEATRSLLAKLGREAGEAMPALQ
jgi:malate dehydrogenase